ncbi:Neurofibromin [Termitomyces sp. J132]|nr:Neurofibromin [Termitomyces sp. J132]
MGNTHQPSLLSLGGAGTPQQKVVHILVNRLRNKLPINSGVPLDRLEADTAVQQVIETLVELSHDSLDMIALNLCDLLERVTRQIDITGYPSIDILQSQLFVLKVLSIIMASRLSQPRSNSRLSRGTPDSPSLTGSTRFSEDQDLVALDEVCAKYVLSVVVMLLRHTYSSDVPLVLPGHFSDLTFNGFDSQTIISAQSESAGEASSVPSSEHVPARARPSDPPLRTQSSANSVRSGKLSLNSTIQIPATKTTYEKTHMMLVKSKTPVIDLIRQYLGRIIFSASNWAVVYSRIRTRIQFLASHTAEHPDPIDLQLMAHCALDRARLVQILTELSSLLVGMGREGHVAIAVPLRAAVWNWITTFPHEFNEALRARGGVGGAPERVFDILYTQNLGYDERIFWPTLTILNCTMSDRMRTDFQDYQASLSGNSVKLTRKEQKFTDEVMKHAYGNSKLFMVALVCLIDICRAATYVGDDSDSPLRMLAHDMAHEVKAALTSRKPFWESVEDIDVALYAEALVVLYRFLPEEDALVFFSTCVEPERSEAVKLCAVRACLTLTQEANRCKWQRPLDKLQEVMSRRLRVVYATSGLRRPEADQYGNLKRPSARPKVLWTSYQPLSDREVLLFGVIALWRMYLDISIKLSAANCIYEVACNFADAPPGIISDNLVAFLKMTYAPTLFSVVINLLHARQDLEAERLWMSIVHQLLELFTRKTTNPAMKETQLHPERVSAFALAEIAFLVSLTSADSNVSAMAGKGLRFLARAEHQPDAPINPTLSDDARSARNLTYEQLGDPTIVVIGRVGHQKRVRKCIRGISYSSAVYVAVWQECYWRWRQLTEIVFEVTENQENGESQPFPPSWEENRSQWQNLTLFLAALGGICVQENQDLTSLAVVVPAHSLPDEMRALNNPAPLVSAFMADLTSMLVAPDTQIRDIARDALGSELSAKLYQKLLRLLDEKIRAFEDSCGPDLNEASQLFLDQYIALLKLIVEKPCEETTDLTNIDISSTAVTLCSFLASFAGPSSYRLKIKFCMMSESACIRSDTLGMQKNSSARRHILDIIIGWIQPTASLGPRSVHMNLEIELNMACLRASVKLLDRLELRPVDVNAGDDSVHVVSRLFNKYSGALLQALETYHSEILATEGMSELGLMHQRIRISQKEANVRELVITGLAHLVSANTESGFKQCLPLAYDEDNRKRAIFAHVFARVIGQGTTFEPEDRSAFSDRNNRLRELVKGSDMALALTICEVCPPQEVGIMINVLLNIFDTRESLIKFMKIMIDRDLAVIDTEQSIFRADTTCTRFFSAFARIHGYNYLRTLLQPLIKIMIEDSSGCGYDLDPTRVSEEEARRNALHVERVAAHFLEILSASVPALPPMFREICAHIMSTVIKTWPEAKYAATGAFMFLRFISPVLVSPELIDIELPKEFTIGMRRGLMVITKIIQNLANNIFFGKEAHMVVLNQFLKANITTVTRFLGDISKTLPAAEAHDQWLGTTSDDTDIIVLHRFFDKHADKIGKELLSLSRASTDPEASTINGKRAWDGLCALLVDHGAPLKVPVLSALPHHEHPEYLALMSRYAGKDTSQVENIFLQAAVPVDQPAVFILKMSKIDVETLDIELLMYHIFKTLAQQDHEDRLFDVVLDCTSFTSICEIPLQGLKYCAELMPFDIRSRFFITHILNPNALTQKYLRRLYNVTAGTQFCDTIRAYSCIAEMRNYVPIQVFSYLTVPVALENEQPQETFFDANMRVVQSRPVILTVGTTHIRITSVKAQVISPGLSCKATEIIPLADISDIYNVATGMDTYEFIIRRSRGGVTEYFSSPSRDSIVKAVRLAKGRLKDMQTPLTERFSRFSNVPATLLHIGLLSVDMNDEELRGAAYDLLGAVCTYLNYDNSPIVASKAGFIPGDATAFVVQLSEKIAAFAPQLTLDFIPEVGAAMNSMDKTAQRISCIQYMSPWIKNLTLFSNPTSKQYERSGARLRDCVRNLADLAVNYPDITSTIQKYIWCEIGKLDPVIVDVVLEELVRTATEGGVGTRRCEAITHAIASLSSIGVRGRIYNKLRKTVCKMFVSQPFNVLTDHPSWNEIATLIRFSLVVAPSSGQAGCDQLYVPEIIHNVTLTAGCGPPLVRKSVYGIIMNLLQALYISRTEETVGPGLLELINECATPARLRLFGLRRDTSTSEYTNWDPASDKETLDTLEELTQFLAKIMEIGSGSKGLLNVWRARWMSLITSTAFQVSPAVQTRAFIALGTLATSEVDDDFLYQILVAFNNALAKVTDSTVSVVSMLRCMCKVVPALPQDSRYICLLFWLAVALLQASHPGFYVEASCLLSVTLESIEQRGMFQSETVPSFLLKARAPLEEVTSQLDGMIGMSFDSSFSFSLASIIFKGMRQQRLKEAAGFVLRTLLQVTVRVELNDGVPNGFKDSISSDVLGYFLALIPSYTKTKAYRQLLRDCKIDDAWLPDAGLNIEDEEGGTPRISPAFLGDDAETEILFALLSDIAIQFPQTVSLAYDTLQDRIKEILANASNPSIIRSVSTIFRLSVQDHSRQSTLRGSSSTLSTVDETQGPGQKHLNALEDLGMQGLANNLTFLKGSHATTMINWIPELVSLIIA